jgi:hypothetical protein
MIDIETMSTNPDAIILNIGAIGFDPFSDEIYSQHSFYSRVDIDSQSNRHESNDTMDWWMKQPTKAQTEAFAEEDRISLETALDELSVVARKCSRVWAHGIAFDMPILEHAYREYRKPYPWQFWNVFDSRTLTKINSIRPIGNSHHALEDCINQITLLQGTIKRLDITKIG